MPNNTFLKLFTNNNQQPGQSDDQSVQYIDQNLAESEIDDDIKHRSRQFMMPEDSDTEQIKIVHQKSPAKSHSKVGIAVQTDQPRLQSDLTDRSKNFRNLAQQQSKGATSHQTVMMQPLQHQFIDIEGKIGSNAHDFLEHVLNQQKKNSESYRVAEVLPPILKQRPKVFSPQ